MKPWCIYDDCVERIHFIIGFWEEKTKRNVYLANFTYLPQLRNGFCGISLPETLKCVSRNSISSSQAHFWYKEGGMLSLFPDIPLWKGCEVTVTVDRLCLQQKSDKFTAWLLPAPETGMPFSISRWSKINLLILSQYYCGEFTVKQMIFSKTNQVSK